jgi:transposase
MLKMRGDHFVNALQLSLPLVPENAILLSDKLAFLNMNGFIHFFNATGIIYRCLDNDKESLKFALGMFSELKLANAKDLSNSFGVSVSTIYRYKDRFNKGFNSPIQGCAQPGFTKLNNEIIKDAQKYLDDGFSIRFAAKQLNISEGAIRYAIKMKRITHSELTASTKHLKPPSQRSKEDIQGDNGIGVKRLTERALARMGRLKEAKPVFSAVDGLSRVGVLLSLPILLSQGLIEIGEKVFGGLKPGFFGLRSVLVCISFMSLLRIKNVEQLKEHSPGDLGLLLGMDRFPEIKTLRRKIDEIGKKGKAKEFSKLLSKHWSDESPEALGYLYIDGHVRAYNGKKNIPKTHISRRRLCMPATTDFWINDSNSEPVFMITTEANDGMLSVIEN